MTAGGTQPPQHDAEWKTARTLKTPEATQFSEWVLLVTDLEYALRRAELWWKLAREETSDQEIIETATSVFKDAVVSFIACFDQQAPVFLDEQAVYTEMLGGVDYFHWLRDLRNTWIAHRNGPQRQCVVTVVVDESSGELTGVGSLQHSYLGPREEAGNDLVRFLTVALVHARRERDRLRELITNQVKAMPSQKRLRLPKAQTVVPSPENIRLGRRRHSQLVALKNRPHRG